MQVTDDGGASSHTIAAAYEASGDEQAVAGGWLALGAQQTCTRRIGQREGWRCDVSAARCTRAQSREIHRGSFFVDQNRLNQLLIYPVRVTKKAI